jgi:NAD-dependent deacetylase
LYTVFFAALFRSTSPGSGVFALSSSNAFSKSQNWQEAAIQASEILAKAKSLLIVTGAGISAESGLPTYRGVSGLYNGVTDEGLPIETCLSDAVYRTNPSVTWKYLLQIEQSCRNAQPSKAHKLLAKAEEYIDKVNVFTQNVDGLHHRAGSTNVLNLHGDMYSLRCTNPSCRATYKVESFAEFEEKGDFPPECRNCQQHTIRPNVVLFDEYLGDETVERYEQILGLPMGKLIMDWMYLALPSSRQSAPFDVALCIGTSALFGYVNAAALSGVQCIEINPSKSTLSDMVDVYIPGGATEVLDFIFDRIGWVQ